MYRLLLKVALALLTVAAVAVAVLWAMTAGRTGDGFTWPWQRKPTVETTLASLTLFDRDEFLLDTKFITYEQTNPVHALNDLPMVGRTVAFIECQYGYGKLRREALRPLEQIYFEALGRCDRDAISRLGALALDDIPEPEVVGKRPVGEAAYFGEVTPFILDRTTGGLIAKQCRDALEDRDRWAMKQRWLDLFRGGHENALALCDLRGKAGGRW